MKFLQTNWNSFFDWITCELNRVSPKVVEFYEALARKEAPQLPFRDLVLNFPEEEIVEPVRKYMLSTIEKPFENIPEKVFLDKNLLPVICYHCNKRGHPAWACKLRVNCSESTPSSVSAGVSGARHS